MQFVIIKEECGNKMDKYGVKLGKDPKYPHNSNRYLYLFQNGTIYISENCSNIMTIIDENDIPDDIKSALKNAYFAWEKSEAEFNNAFEALKAFYHKDDITLSEFIREFLKHIPIEVKKEMLENDYNIITNFSDSDFSGYNEYDEISGKELKIIRKKIAADDENTVKACDLEFNGNTTHMIDIKAMKLRIKLFEENSRPLSVLWNGEHYLKKEIKSKKPVMIVCDEYSISFGDAITKEYAKKLADAFVTTDGRNNALNIIIGGSRKKLHKKTYSIQ